MPRKPLRQEQVPRGPVDVRDRGVPERMEWVQPIEPRLDLQLTEQHLHAALRDPPAGLGAEEGRVGIDSLSLFDLPCPEPQELRLEAIRQEHVAGATSLRDLGAQADADPWLASREVDVSDI